MKRPAETSGTKSAPSRARTAPRGKAPRPAPRPVAGLPQAVLDRLVDAPELHDFFAVMRTLEARHPHLARIGDSDSLRQEIVGLGQDPFLVFPDSNLSAARRDRKGRMRILVRFLGMLGPQGALPLALTDEAGTYLVRGDEALPRFLDLFNNRFLQLFYRAWADVRPIAQADRPAEDRFRAYIGATIGIGSPRAAGLDSLPDEVKLHFAGLMGAQAKSASRLASLLSGAFRVRTEVEEFIGSWLGLDPSDRSSLGAGNAVLGGTLMLGHRMFSVSDKFRIRLITGSLAEYEAFLPSGALAQPLRELVTFYIGEEFDWDIELAIPAGKVRPMQLGRSGHLGWTSWMSPDWSVAEDTLRHDARFHVQDRFKQTDRPVTAG